MKKLPLVLLILFICCLVTIAVNSTVQSIQRTNSMPPEASLDPTSLTFNLTTSDAPAVQSSTLTNTGEEALTYQISSILLNTSKAQNIGQNTVPTDLVYNPANYKKPFAPGRKCREKESKLTLGEESSCSP